ncbi:unnamed protein product [Lampetra planeri]
MLTRRQALNQSSSDEESERIPRAAPGAEAAVMEGGEGKRVCRGTCRSPQISPTYALLSPSPREHSTTTGHQRHDREDLGLFPAHERRSGHGTYGSSPTLPTSARLSPPLCKREATMGHRRHACGLRGNRQEHVACRSPPKF